MYRIQTKIKPNSQKQFPPYSNLSNFITTLSKTIKTQKLELQISDFKLSRAIDINWIYKLRNSRRWKQPNKRGLLSTQIDVNRECTTHWFIHSAENSQKKDEQNNQQSLERTFKASTRNVCEKKGKNRINSIAKSDLQNPSTSSSSTSSCGHGSVSRKQGRGMVILI